jgi:hypothetical protein
MTEEQEQIVYELGLLINRYEETLGHEPAYKGRPNEGAFAHLIVAATSTFNEFEYVLLIDGIQKVNAESF